MRWIMFLTVSLCVFVSLGRAAAADFEADAAHASGILEKVLPIAAAQMNAGDFKTANEGLLAVFPEEKRTAAESFVLGNILFDADRKLSYALHQAAAKAEPGNAAVVWEWGLEQHRAGEYAGALASYQIFSKSRPQSAAPYALEADCLLHLNRIVEAAEAWHQSEVAPTGSLEAMESLVCAVHSEPAPHQRRADLLAKATGNRDIGAACDLIALDCDFPQDWWNHGPVEAYLKHDLPAIAAALKLPPEDVLGRAMSCAAECAAAPRDEPAAVKAILAKYKLLIDADQSIPAHGGLLSIIVLAAQQSKAIDDAALRDQIGPKLLDLARKGKDAELWNVAMFVALPEKPEEQLKLEREGWEATGDARFAAGLLFVKSRQGKLKGDDADLVAAMKQFPDSGIVQRFAFEVAASEKKLTRELLANAAMAEFNHLSSFVAPATVVNRPRSNYLRQYFAELRVMAAAEKPATKPAPPQP